MNKIASAGTALVVYVAAASASWFVVGDRLWSGSDVAQVGVPAVMTLFTFVAGEGVLAGVRRLTRRSPL